jgi:fucose permease
LGVLITAFISAASSVTQDVVHAGMRAMSYAVAVVIQNLLGASMGPYIIGLISDRSDIGNAMTILPVALLISAILFFCGSFFYEKDLKKVEIIELQPN